MPWRGASCDGNQLPPAAAVRVEEMINYFPYGYAPPADRSVPFRAAATVLPSPWNKETKLLHIGIKGFDIPRAERPPPTSCCWSTSRARWRRRTGCRC